MNYGKAIKDMRLAMGITIHQLANRTGLGVNYIKDIEAGLSFPESDLRHFADGLNLPLIFIKFLATDESDVPENKLDSFRRLSPMVGDLILDFVKPAEVQGTDAENQPDGTTHQ